MRGAAVKSTAQWCGCAIAARDRLRAKLGKWNGHLEKPSNGSKPYARTVKVEAAAQEKQNPSKTAAPESGCFVARALRYLRNLRRKTEVIPARSVTMSSMLGGSGTAGGPVPSLMKV